MINTLPELILSKVCEYYKVDKSKVKSQLKKKDYVKARQMYAYLCNSMTGLTLEKIGELINRDHSTIIYSVSKMNNLSSIYSDVNIEIKEITNLIECLSISVEVKHVDLLYQAQINTQFLSQWKL